MTDHTHDIQRYVELRTQIAALEAEIETIKPRLAVHIHGVGGRLEFGDYLIRSGVSRTWQYSDEVAGLKTLLRDTRRREIEQGIATIKRETRYVSMTSLKRSGSSQTRGWVRRDR